MQDSKYGGRGRSLAVIVLLLGAALLALTALVSLATAEVSVTPQPETGASAEEAARRALARPSETATPTATRTAVASVEASATTTGEVSLVDTIMSAASFDADIFLPLVSKYPTAMPRPTKTPTPRPTATPNACQSIPGVSYSTLPLNPPPTDRPAEQHGDLNLALRGYELTSAAKGLVYYNGNPDGNAPQLYSLFGDNRTPAFTNVYRVRDWDWGCNCRGGAIAYPAVTLLGMGTTPGEIIRVPRSGYDVGQGYTAFVLYASEDRITLKYTREDNVVRGYTVHIEGVCTEPSLLSLYRARNDAGRGSMPVLAGGQPLGRARGGEIRIAIRDTGTFMDPRARRDWWQGR